MGFTHLMASAALIALLAQPALAQNQSTARQQQGQQTQAGDQQLAQASGGGQSGSPQEERLGGPEIAFATKAAEGGLKEVQLGELAQQQAQSQEVQQFGQRMVEDHSEANEQLMQIAQEKGMQLPQDLSEEAQQLYDELQQKSGREFDQAYMDEMVSDHEEDVQAFEEYVQTGTDPDLVTFAQETLPTLEEHLELAKQTQKQVSASAGQPQSTQQAAAGGQTQAQTGQQQMVSIDEVIGSTVVNRQGEDVGSIEDIVMDSDQSRFAIVSVGGFLGIGDRNVAIPMDQLQLGEDESYLMSAQTEEELEDLPEYQEGQYQSAREQRQGQLQQ